MIELNFQKFSSYDYYYPILLYKINDYPTYTFTDPDVNGGVISSSYDGADTLGIVRNCSYFQDFRTESYIDILCYLQVR